jgi:hypothetical protein
VVSDNTGEFLFAALPAGEYTLSWQANGFVPGSLSPISIANVNVDLDPIQLTPILIPLVSGWVYGQIALADGSPVFKQDPFFSINVSPVVTLKSSNGKLLGLATVNSGGTYVMAGITPQPGQTLSATVENATATLAIDTTSTSEGDLVVPDSQPMIEAVVATINGQQVYRVSPGATVQVTAYATDPDGNPLNYSPGWAAKQFDGLLDAAPNDDGRRI